MITKDGVLYAQIIEKGQSIPGHEYPQPLYFMLAQPLHRITGLSPQTAGHVTTLFFGVACIALVYGLTLRAGGPLLAALTATLLAVHPHTVFIDTDVSNSSLATFWIILSVLCMAKAIRDGSIFATFVCPGLVLLGIMSRREAMALVPLMIMAPFFFFLLSSAPRFRHFLQPTLKFILIGGATAAVELVLACTLIPGISNRLYEIAQASHWSLTAAPTDGANPKAVTEFLHDAVRSIFIPLAPFVLLGLALAHRYVRNRSLTCTALFFVICSFGTVLIRTLVHGPEFASSRYFLNAAPFVMIFAAAGLLFLRDWLRKKPALVMLLFAIAFLPCLVYVVYPPHRNEAPYREAADYIRKTYGAGRTVAATRSQIAYYAGARHVQLTDGCDLSRVDFVVLRSGDEMDKLIQAGKAKSKHQFGKDVWLLEPVK